MTSLITLLGFITLVAAWTASNCGSSLPCPRSYSCNIGLEVCEAASGVEDERVRVLKSDNSQKITVISGVKYLIAIQPIQLRTYLKISISLCSQNSSFGFTPKFWKYALADFDMNGISNRLQSYSKLVSGECSLYIFEQIAFIQQIGNQPQNLLIEVNNQLQESQLSISVFQEKYGNVYMLYHLGNIILVATAVLSLLVGIWKKCGRKVGGSGPQGQIMMENATGEELKYFDIYLPRRKFSQLRVEENMCPICLIGMQPSDLVRQTPCLHVFHLSCLDSWCANRRICPICRCSLAKSHILTLIDKEEEKEPRNHQYPCSVQLKDCGNGVLQEML